MLYNGAIGKGTALADYFRVLYHGASLDAATAGYLTAIPWLVILISFWLKRVPLRKILGGYYLLIALIVSCIGIADMSLYPFGDSSWMLPSSSTWIHPRMPWPVYRPDSSLYALYSS